MTEKECKLWVREQAAGCLVFGDYLLRPAQLDALVGIAFAFGYGACAADVAIGKHANAVEAAHDLETAGS